MVSDWFKWALGEETPEHHGPDPRGWETHAADLDKLGTRPVNRSVVAADRAAENAR